MTVAMAVPTGARAANQMVSALPSDVFSPVEVTVNQGEQVTWTNEGGNHNVVFDDGSFEMPANASTAAWTVSRTFDAGGDFRYFCVIHGGPNGEDMSGIVHVVAGPSNPPPSGPPQPGPPGGNPPSGPGAPKPSLELLSVTLKVSDATPLARKLVRVSGVVRPARDGRKVQIQKRLRNRKWKTVATTRLRDGGAAKSVYSVRLRLSADAVLRARVAGDDRAGTGVSKGRKLDVHSPA